MRRAAAVDANQAEIVKALRGIGATVSLTHRLGEGFPDICVGYHGRNILMEIKDGSKPPSARRLTASEAEWHSGWKGQVVIVESVDDALIAIGIKARELQNVPIEGVVLPDGRVIRGL